MRTAGLIILLLFFSFINIEPEVPKWKLENLRDDINTEALQKMIRDLRASFPESFAKADDFFSRLDDLEKDLFQADQLLSKDPSPGQLKQISNILDKAIAFQREIALSNPLLNSQPILFVVRDQYLADHHNTETIFQTGEHNCSSYRPGGQLKIFDPVTGKSSLVFDAGPTGLVRDPEVHFDGRKILFSWRRSVDENYSIYELQVNPQDNYKPVRESLRRLTNEPEATDIDPLYMPDGQIIFSSTRELKYCHCNMHPMANLHRMDGDGANIHQISRNTLFDGHPSLLPDGRVLYYRWEYVDRNYADAQGLWTVNPDGTNHSVYWGNNTVSPAAVFDGRFIPGSDRVVCIFGSCHDRPWGAMAIINRSKGIDDADAVEHLLPEKARSLISIDGSGLSSPFSPDLFVLLRSRYEDPFPLVNPVTGKGGKYFLVSRNYNYLPPDKEVRYQKDVDELRMGLYLVDVFGNEILFHSEGPGCFDPVPLAPSPRPVMIPDRRDYASTSGTMYVNDVYEGTHMQGVERGEVKKLRIVESIEKSYHTVPLWRCAQYVTEHNGKTMTGNTLNRPAVSWAGFETKRVLGTVPVEQDGSAYFEVPAEKFIYFQLLDGEGKMINTMRSGTMVQPGEVLGCTGCHENRLMAPPQMAIPMAIRDDQDKPDNGYDTIRAFNYLDEVQPVWDRHCIGCHDFGREAGEKLNLSGDKELVFNASYAELFRNWGHDDALLNTVGLGLAPINEPYSIGSHKSRLVGVLENGHQGVKLSDEEMDRIITWIDIGGPYYADYACAHPDNVAGRAPLTIEQVRRLEVLTNREFLNSAGNPSFAFHRFLISFERPELSPCLDDLEKNSPAYLEALEIIKAGAEELAVNPDADLPGFTYCPEHKALKEKYQSLRKKELMRRRAIAKGRKIYDPVTGVNSE